MTSSVTVGSRVNAKGSNLQQNVKIWRTAKVSKAATKDTPKGAKGLHGEIVDLKMVVLITTRSQLSMKIINFLMIK